MRNIEKIKKRVVTSILNMGGSATRNSIMQDTRGKSSVIVSALLGLVSEGILTRQGLGVKGEPAIYAIVEKSEEPFIDEEVIVRI